MAGPVAVARSRPPRLQTLNDPSSIPVTSSRTSIPPRTYRPPLEDEEIPPHKQCCSAPNHSTEESPQVCYNCGRTFNESEIVAEVTFGETASGAATVQGGFVGETQRHANTMGGTARGIGGLESRMQTEGKGRLEIQKLCASLRIRTLIEDQAFQLYKLALGHNFVQGRRIRNVASVCIYLAARRQPNNTVLLMDLSEKIQVNVWKLGDTYKQFLQTIMLEDPANVQGTNSLQQIEPLMLKFCRKLEFGDDSFRVAEDAVGILRRMSRDWMVQGRQPAGICGACIILAARMNNFRRTVREVVYVVKVADSTINQRLLEFKRTKSSALTVKQFREFGQRIRDEIMPPSIYRRAEKEERKRKRVLRDAGEDVGEEEEEDPPSEAEGVAGPSAHKRRKSGNGHALPVDTGGGEDPADSEASGDQEALEAGGDLDYLADLDDAEDIDPLPQKSRRGRPPKKREPIVIAEEDLEVEAELEEEVQGSLEAWDSIFAEFKNNEAHPIFVASKARAQNAVRTHMPDANIPTGEDIHESEFEDDEDVKNCINTPAEVRMKERVWVTENEDWLRAQQAKLLAAELEEASGKSKKPKQRRKHTQMGDGSVLGDKPAGSAAEAVKRMMEKRANGQFSSFVDYSRLQEFYGGPVEEGQATEGSGQEQPHPSWDDDAEEDFDNEFEEFGEFETVYPADDQ